MVTLGISTNTRLLGIAIISQGQLVDYSIHLHKSPWSAAKAKKIITSLEPCVHRYCINKAVLSMPPHHHQTEEFKILIRRIQGYLKEKQIPYCIEPAQAIRALCSPEERVTKKALMESLVSRFPELRYCYDKEIRNKTKYYIKLFEAVAVAVLQKQKN